MTRRGGRCCSTSFAPTTPPCASKSNDCSPPTPGPATPPADTPGNAARGRPGGELLHNLGVRTLCPDRHSLIEPITLHDSAEINDCHSPVEPITLHDSAEINCGRCGSAIRLEAHRRPPGIAAPVGQRHSGGSNYSKFSEEVPMARSSGHATPTSTVRLPSRCRTLNASPTPRMWKPISNEARILARLDHPNIVPVYRRGSHGRRSLLRGLEARRRQRPGGQDQQGRPSFRDSAELVATIADALHYAHTRGLVHRDIKPANILIDASGKPCVADFGLALKDEDFGKGGGLAGTPAYMSPEASQGRRSPGRWAFGHLQPGRGLLRVVDRATTIPG